MININQSQSTAELTPISSPIFDLDIDVDVDENSHEQQLQAQREQLLGAIAEYIRQSLDLDTLLKQTVTKLRKFLTCDRVLVYCFDIKENGFITVESTVTPGKPLLGMQVKDPCFVEKHFERYKQGCIQVVEDIYAAELAPCYVDWLASLDIRANLVIPILSGKDLWGLLIAQQCYQPRRWQQTEIDLLKQLATQLEIALQQAELHQQVHQLQLQLELQMQKQNQEREKLEHLKHEFLRTLSHELRTPITSINLAAQTLENVLQQEGLFDIELVPQLLHILHQECGRESKLINDLLTLAYLDAEAEPLTLIVIDLQIWLPPIIELYRERINCQQQQLNLYMPSELSLIETDITDLERILTELMNNACKFTPPGESITVSVSQAGDTVLVSVSNSGVEISKNELSRIFDPFYRVPNNDPWKFGGTGLGLALVQKLVKHLGGTIEVNSVANTTSFTIQFPSRVR
jgi:signal transduction histidine kinase